MSSQPPILIVGGGISGLTTAFYLDRALDAQADGDDDRPHIHVFEASARFGGPVGTEHVDGFLLERGPDSFLGTPPHVVRLAEDLGLGDALITPRPCTPPLYVWARGKLRAMPRGTRLVVPGDIRAFLASDLLTRRGKARVMMEPLVPAGDLNGDVSMGAFFRRRFGDELVETLIAPILAGIYSGDIDTLSLGATFPRFIDQVREHGSLIRAALAAPKPANGAPRSPFRTLRDGVGGLIDALLDRLRASAHVSLHAKARVGALEARADDAHGPEAGARAAGWRLRVDAGDAALAAASGLNDALDDDGWIAGSAVVLGVPAFVSGRLLSSHAPALAADVATTPYTSTVGVYLGLGPDGPVNQIPTSAGVLFPRSGAWRIKGVQLGANKYPGRAPDGGALLRVFMGGVGATHLLELDDESLITIARRELSDALGVRLSPRIERVMRYPRRAPQYLVGHRERMDRALGGVPSGVHLVGAGYRGIGLPACVESARTAAETIAAATG